MVSSSCYLFLLEDETIYIKPSLSPLVPFDSYNWFTLGGQNQLMESKEEQGEERECMRAKHRGLTGGLSSLFIFASRNWFSHPMPLKGQALDGTTFS